MTPQQATKQLLDMGCNYLSVVDIEGNTLVPKQQNKFTEPADIKKQADKVMNYVKTAPEGTYVIEGRIGSTSKPTQIVVSKGESAPATAAAPTAAAPSRGIADPGECVELQRRAKDAAADRRAYFGKRQAKRSGGIAGG